MKFGIKICIATTLFLLHLTPSLASLPEDLTELSIEELADIEVISVSRKPQKLSQAPAAVFVITSEDIRRSGATSIPEVLRMVPGLHVAKISSSQWAVTSRGFNSRYANKLLVQLDGRTLYSPLFSGVFWETKDTFLDDIDRIEVIRGPGASLWGANAVNGIINIITKHSSQTKGGLAYGGGGTWDRTFGGARYGGGASEDSSYRVYSTYASYDESVNSDGSDAGDQWERVRGGFRSDFNIFHNSSLTLQGDLYKGSTHEISEIPTYSPPYTTPYENENNMSGFNLLGRFSRQFSANSDMAVQLYYDNTEKEESTTSWRGDIVDLDFQHRFTPNPHHELIWGFGYRFYQDDIDWITGFRFKSPSEEDHLFSAFIQDSFTFSDTLRFIFGAKVEHNDYTGFEFQPNGRVSWSPHRSHHFWGAASRAVRTPNRADTSILFDITVIPPGTPENPGPLPAAVTLTGSDDFESEELIAYEFGYRAILPEGVSIDSALFYYSYNNIYGNIAAAPYAVLESVPPHTVIPLTIINAFEANTWGAEIAANWQPAPPVRLQAACTWFGMDMDTGSATASTTENDAPSHQVSLRTSVDVFKNTQCDIWIRFVDDILNKSVSSYTELDLRLAWKPVEFAELSIVGQNLLDDQHPEFIEPFLWSAPAEVKRSVYGKLSITF